MSANGQPASEGDSPPQAKRVHSTVKFPYVGLDEVSAISETMLNTYSGNCSTVQLAAALNQKASSGAFRVKITGAKMFGAVTGKGEHLILTRLGSELVDVRTRRAARVTAFLAIPLYKAMFEEASRQSGMVPNNIRGLEQMIVRLGVVPGQAETARLAFQRSARFAGFHAHGTDKLIAPAVATTGGPESEPKPEPAPNPSPKGSDVLPGKPTLIAEIFRRLPDEGATFTVEDRVRWGTALKATLDLVYPESAKESMPQGTVVKP